MENLLLSHQFLAGKRSCLSALYAVLCAAESESLSTRHWKLPVGPLAWSSSHEKWEVACGEFNGYLFSYAVCRWEKDGQVSRELWEKAGQQGLLGVAIAEKHGGIGADILSSAVLWEEQ